MLLAPAKINTTLKILGKREDGYHEISSVMRALSLCDEIDVKSDVKIAQGETEGFFVGIRCSDKNVPVDGTNLASRAAFLLRESVAGQISGTVEIDIKKNIPIGAGLAGGSADAAAVLLALAKLWGLSAPLSELAKLAMRLGADVPFCLYTCAAANNYAPAFTSALAEGIGEKLTPRTDEPPYSVLLVKPDVFVSTAEIYAAYDEDRLLENLCKNILQPICESRYPIVRETRETLTGLCPAAAETMMSGSGPTLFSLFEDERDACAAYEKATLAFPDMQVFLARTL